MNTSKNIYLRPALRQRGVQPTSVVPLLENAMDRLDDIVARPPVEWTPLEAFDLLAITGRFQRLRPEVVAAVVGSSLRQAKTLMTENIERLFTLALEVPNINAWQQQCLALEASFEQDMLPAERADLTCQIIEDLDDADLAMAMCRQSCREDKDLSADLEACNAWLEEHAGVFLEAGAYIQAMAAAFDPALPHSPVLATTGRKFAVLLDELEIAMDDTVNEDAVLLLDDFAARHGFNVIGKICREWPARAELCAAAANAETEKPGRTLWWQSSDGRYQAFLPLPAKLRPDASDLLRLTFCQADGSAAPEMAGRAVQLGGQSLVVSADGQADITASDLEQAGAPLALCVDGAAWFQFKP